MSTMTDDALARMGLRFRPATEARLADLSAALGRPVPLPARFADDGGLIAGGTGRITDILLPARRGPTANAVDAWHWVLQDGRPVAVDRLVEISAADADFSYASRFSAEWALSLDRLDGQALRSRLLSLIARLDRIPAFRDAAGDPLFVMHINAPSAMQPAITGDAREEVQRLARSVLKAMPDDHTAVAMVLTGSGLVMLELRGLGTVRFFSPAIADRHRPAARSAPKAYATPPAENQEQASPVPTAAQEPFAA